MKQKGCAVEEGLWDDYYFPETHQKAKHLDIDHLIPLKHAHEFGASNWSQDAKKTFANDPDNLVITNRRYNRAKGSKSPAEWLPINHAYACRYVRDWKNLKIKYRLKITREEIESIKGCD